MTQRGRTADPARLRRRGLLWLDVGFAVCPCHLPFTLLAVGTLLGGTAVGAMITGNPLAVGVVLGTFTALAYVRGLRLLGAADGCATAACDPAAGREGADRPEVVDDQALRSISATRNASSSDWTRLSRGSQTDS